MRKILENKQVTLMGLLVSMGIVYGDIGTSPLYVMKAIIAGQGGLNNVSDEFIIGSISLIIWTITLITTLKYVLIALTADNNGEGGIFALYSLIKKVSPYLIIPAIIGGSALLADGILTPAVTITTAIEGLRNIPLFYEYFGQTKLIIVLISVTVLFLLYSIQKFGTEKIGSLFGPIMFLWFTFLGFMGFTYLVGNFYMLKALNPYYAIELLNSPTNKMGFLILGSIFLATTGAEALYSDLGHAGINNIRISFIYVKLCLVLSYLGQGAFLINIRKNANYNQIEDLNPFFEMIPQNLSLFSVIFATIAAFIASQSLISGSFSLVSEAIELKIMPKLKIYYPSQIKGQMYIPLVNMILGVSSILLVIVFKTSHKLEAAYGLAITIAMLMTTLLLFIYLLEKKTSKILSYLFLFLFLSIEGIFFLSSLGKFTHGGYVSIIFTFVFATIMFIYKIKNNKKSPN